MNVSSHAITRRVSKFTPALIGAALSLTIALASSAVAQSPSGDKPAEAKAPAEAKVIDTRPPDVRQTFFLSNVTQQFDLNDIQTDLRNMLTRAKIYGVASQNAISVAGTEEDVQLAQKIISELDRPKSAYRVTYTFTDFDGGKRLGSQQYSLDVMQGAHSELKQGTKVPIVTGSYSHDSSSSETQTQFEDVGLKIEAWTEGVQLHTHIERSSLSDEKSGVGPQDPIIRETALQGLTLLHEGKPVVLGTLDVPGTGRRQQIEVATEAIP
jgi:type II secretory pathway component GspD/PulD (secretin)